MMLVRLREIDDAEHHEDERLQQPYDQVKAGPGQPQDELQHDQSPTANAGQRVIATREREQCNEDEYHFAGVEVAVKTQREGDGAREEHHRLEQQVDRYEQRLHQHVLVGERVQRELRNEAAQALHADAVEDDEHEHREREAEYDVEIRARHVLEVGEPHAVGRARQQVHRNQVHEVEEEYPAKDGEGEWGNELAGALEGILDLRVDEPED